MPTAPQAEARDADVRGAAEEDSGTSADDASAAPEPPDATISLRDRIVGLRRPFLVFAIAALILGVLAGERMWKPSTNNHFVRLGHGWLQGRMHVEGKPPGYCATKTKRGACRHAYDDYARLVTLERRDGTGEAMRAYPCKTRACAERKRSERIVRWYIVGQGWQDFGIRDLRPVKDSEVWYITFPPGPTVAMLPFIAVFGLGTLDVLLTVLAGALVPAVLVVLLDRERGSAGSRGVAHLYAAAALTVASPLLWLAANGQVWFTAQVFCALFLMLFLLTGLRGTSPVAAGLSLGMAVACRPTAALPAALIFIAWWWRQGRPIGPGLRFAASLGLCGAALALHNYVRFEDIFEFGHRFLEIRWQPRIQEIGLFSTQYLERNLKCLLTLLPVSDPKYPWRVSIHGSALWVGAPWVVAALWARRRFEGRGAVWLSIAAAAVPALLYQNSGQLQYSYRFAADWLPLFVVAVVLGGAFDPRPRGFRDWRNLVVPAAIVLGASFQAWGAYNFERAKGKLFVGKPQGWPFADELRDNQ